MICFAAITPHTPLLIPSIGKENLNHMSATRDAMQTLEEELYASQPDTIVIISSHATQHQDAFSLNLHEEYVVDLKDFGDLATTRSFQADLGLASDIQQHMHTHEIPLTLDSSASLDYGSGVPLYLLTQNLEDIRILPVSYSGLCAKDHVRFGAELKDVLEQSTKRIAVIASGDLSHCLSDEAPLGYRPEGEMYDKKVVDAVKGMSTSALLSLSPELIEQANACIQEQLLILFGILERKKARVHELSYEHPFGVGYLVVHIQL